MIRSGTLCSVIEYGLAFSGTRWCGDYRAGGWRSGVWSCHRRHGTASTRTWPDRRRTSSTARCSASEADSRVSPSTRYSVYLRTASRIQASAVDSRVSRITNKHTDKLTTKPRSCAEHLTVESYTIIISLQSYIPGIVILVIGIPSPTHSFTLGLNPSFSANPPYRSLSFFSFRFYYMDFPDCLLLLLSISVFLLFSFFLFLHFFSCRFRAVD